MGSQGAQQPNTAVFGPGRWIKAQRKSRTARVSATRYDLVSAQYITPRRCAEIKLGEQETDFDCTGFGYMSDSLDDPDIYGVCHLYADSSNCGSTSGGTPNDALHWYTCKSKPCATQASLPDSLVGYWPLDGAGNDVSGHGLAAADTNGEWVAGLYKQAFRFSGDDVLIVPESDLLNVQKVTMMVRAAE
jgi:hypothetical protein